MQESDERRILSALETALEVLRKNCDNLSVAEVRLQSMLAVLREELVQRYDRVRGALDSDPLPLRKFQ